jgi:hypothetical protein
MSQITTNIPGKNYTSLHSTVQNSEGKLYMQYQLDMFGQKLQKGYTMKKTK